MKTERRGAELTLAPDSFNEQIVWAAAVLSREFRSVAVRHPPDVFQVPVHREIWTGIREAHKQGLDPTSAVLLRLSRGKVDVTYVEEVLRGRPDVPSPENLRKALDALLWDHKRFEVLTGPVSTFLECITDGEGDRGRLLGLARAIPTSLDGWGDRSHLRDPEELLSELATDLRERMAGRKIYPYGLPTLDFLESGERRLVPGAAPGMVTIITGQKGMGKSTFTARLVLGLARQEKRVLYAAWEMTDNITLELLACMSLAQSSPIQADWSRRRLQKKTQDGGLTEEEHAVLVDRARKISKYVRFVKNPFRRTVGEKPTNERNLDLIHGYLADSAPDVAVFDLWERCLASDETSEEKRALFRQQAMAEELGIHCILLAQQRKDVFGRPTLDGIKGSGAWGEIADTALGVYREYFYKDVPDNELEVLVLKQRYAPAMLAVQFDWDADRGMITNGKSIDFQRPESQRGGSSNPVDVKVNPRKKK